MTTLEYLESKYEKTITKDSWFYPPKEREGYRITQNNLDENGEGHINTWVIYYSNPEGYSSIETSSKGIGGFNLSQKPFRVFCERIRTLEDFQALERILQIPSL